MDKKYAFIFIVFTVVAGGYFYNFYQEDKLEKIKKAEHEKEHKISYVSYRHNDYMGFDITTNINAKERTSKFAIMKKNGEQTIFNFEGYVFINASFKNDDVYFNLVNKLTDKKDSTYVYKCSLITDACKQFINDDGAVKSVSLPNPTGDSLYMIIKGDEANTHFLTEYKDGKYNHLFKYGDETCSYLFPANRLFMIKNEIVTIVNTAKANAIRPGCGGVYEGSAKELVFYDRATGTVRRDRFTFYKAKSIVGNNSLTGRYSYIEDLELFTFDNWDSNREVNRYQDVYVFCKFDQKQCVTNFIKPRPQDWIAYAKPRGGRISSIVMLQNGELNAFMGNSKSMTKYSFSKEDFSLVKEEEIEIDLTIGKEVKITAQKPKGEN